MKTFLLGQTTLPVTRIGLGMAALGRPGYINLGHAEDLDDQREIERMRARSHTMLDEAWRSGIRYFDAARSYGKAEEFLGSWLASRDIDPTLLTIASKWGYTYTADWQVTADKHEVKEHTGSVLKRQIAESQSLLAPYLRLYQIHSATLDSGALDDQEVLDELARLRDDGLTIGLSLSGPKQAETLRKAMTVKRGGERLFRVVQATWNLLELSVEDALVEAKSIGMGVVIKEALANGRLTSRNDEPEFRDKLALLQEVASDQQTTVDAVALAAVLAQPWVDIVLSGAATVTHLQSNLAALSVQWSDTIAEHLVSLREPTEEYWATRSRLAWN